jgi:hypothetical protein
MTAYLWAAQMGAETAFQWARPKAGTMDVSKDGTLAEWTDEKLGGRTAEETVGLMAARTVSAMAVKQAGQTDANSAAKSAWLRASG